MRHLVDDHVEKELPIPVDGTGFTEPLHINTLTWSSIPSHPTPEVKQQRTAAMRQRAQASSMEHAPIQ